MAKRKQKTKRVTKTTSKKQQLQNISKININIGREIEKRFKKQDDRVTLQPSFTSSTTFLPTTPSNTVLLEAPNRQYATVPEPLRRNVYATLPAVSNPVTVQPLTNGVARDPNPAIGVPIVQATNVNDLAPKQAQRRIIPNRNVIPNFSVSSTPSSRPRASPSIPISVPPPLMLAPKQRQFSGFDLIERNPNEAQRPVDIQQANAIQQAFRTPSTPVRPPLTQFQPFVRTSEAKGRPSMQEGIERMKHSEEQFYRMMGIPRDKKLSQ